MESNKFSNVGALVILNNPNTNSTRSTHLKMLSLDFTIQGIVLFIAVELKEVNEEARLNNKTKFH